MIHLLLLVLAAAGFYCLCAGNSRYQHDLLDRRLAPDHSRTITIAGWASLALCAAGSIALLGAYGAVEIFGMLTVGAAFTVAFRLIRCEREKR
ncbi:DUF3325 domain-containing protein [Sphingomonas sp. ID0503]|uniref:DUF3325 domain-containing protein n=1 Tax=Sphingomonas sp. ID0503 TaxID=3399691 RepID=UPI003AFA86BA